MFGFVGLNELTGWSKKSPRTTAWCALALAIVGGCASVTHLSHPERMMNALSHPTSGIFTEAVLVGILSVCIIVFLVCAYRGIAGGQKAFGVIGGVFGLLLAFMAGYSYIMEAETAWATALLPVGYLATALAMGAGLWWALAAPDQENGAKEAVLSALVCSVVGLLGICAWAASSGAFTAQAAIVVVALVCEAAAIVLALAARKNPQSAYAWTFVAATVVAGLLYRVLMWTMGGGIYGFFG